MLNRFRFPALSEYALRLQNGFGYNNGKLYNFLCKKYNLRAEAKETLPSLILAKGRGKDYTDANLWGAQNRRELNNNGTESRGFPRNRRFIIMFQKIFHEAGALCYGSLMLTSNMNKAGVEDNFDRLRKQEAARKNRSTASHGMFYRKGQAYRHA